MCPQLLVVLALCSVCLTEHNPCDPFGYHLDEDCEDKHDTYLNIRRQFEASSSGNHRPVIYDVIQLYRFAHPCASRGEAAYNIFKQQDIDAYDTSYEHTWIRLTDEVFDNDPNYPDDSDQLQADLNRMRHHDGAGCLTALLNEFGGLSSREEFFRHYPEVHHTSPRPTTTSTHTIATTTPTTTPNPTTTMAATTSPTTASTTTTTTTSTTLTTTPTPTTTTATTSPATTSTTAITTTTTTTPTTTPTPTTTTAAPTSPAAATTTTTTITSTTTTASGTSASTTMGYACTVCDNLECLLHVHRRQCAHSEPYCLTTVKDTLRGRTITRSCADSQRCPGGLIMPDARCAKVEESGQELGTTCHYCCSGHDCNAPPYLLPPTGFVGFGN